MEMEGIFVLGGWWSVFCFFLLLWRWAKDDDIKMPETWTELAVYMVLFPGLLLWLLGDVIAVVIRLLYGFLDKPIRKPKKPLE